MGETCYRHALHRNAERNDAIERRRSKLKALADRAAAAAGDEDAKAAAGSPRARRRRMLMRPTHVDSHHMEHPRHMAGAGSVQKSPLCVGTSLAVRMSAMLLAGCLQC